MKSLTIRQPYASLIALKAKTIETRPWSTPYRGSVAIHAGLAPLDPEATRRILAALAAAEGGTRFMNRLDRWWDHHTWICPLGHVSTCLLLTKEGDRCLACRRRPLGLVPPEWANDFARGAIVAVCDLVACLPIVCAYSKNPDTGEYDVPSCITAEDPNDHDRKWLINGDGPSWWKDARDQLPFGDFSEGRFAWMLDNVRAVDPIPMRGHQGLRDITDPAILKRLAA